MSTELPQKRNKIPSPFKIVTRFQTDELVFEADFPLPDDGISPNLLVIRVIMDGINADTCRMSVINRVSKDRCIISADNVRVVDLGELLYGFARLKTRHFLELI